LLPYGWNDRWAALAEQAGGVGAVVGRVVRHDSSALMLAQPDGIAQVSLRPGTEAVAVGDWVIVASALAGPALAGPVLTRTSLLRRAHPDGGEQLLAANVDLVVIVAGLDRPVKTNRIQRTVTLAADAGATPLVVLSKSDLADDVEKAVESVKVANPDVDVIAISSTDGCGLDELRSRIKQRTIVLMGESGAGKSTLTNALVGSPVAATGAVRAGDAKGRHTTTSRELHLGEDASVIIDTPGLRAVGVWTDPATVAASFSDVAELAECCRFRDCHHDGEPGCSVLAAAASGAVAKARVEAFRALAQEALAIEVRAQADARRRPEARGPRRSHQAQRHKGKR